MRTVLSRKVIGPIDRWSHRPLPNVTQAFDFMRVV